MALGCVVCRNNQTPLQEFYTIKCCIWRTSTSAQGYSQCDINVCLSVLRMLQNASAYRCVLCVCYAVLYYAVLCCAVLFLALLCVYAVVCITVLCTLFGCREQYTVLSTVPYCIKLYVRKMLYVLLKYASASICVHV